MAPVRRGPQRLCRRPDHDSTALRPPCPGTARRTARRIAGRRRRGGARPSMCRAGGPGCRGSSGHAGSRGGGRGLRGRRRRGPGASGNDHGGSLARGPAGARRSPGAVARAGRCAGACCRPPADRRRPPPPGTRRAADARRLPGGPGGGRTNDGLCGSRHRDRGARGVRGAGAPRARRTPHHLAHDGVDGSRPPGRIPAPRHQAGRSCRDSCRRRRGDRTSGRVARHASGRSRRSRRVPVRWSATGPAATPWRSSTPDW